MKGWESACLPEALGGGGPQPRVGTADLSHSVPGSMEAGAGAGAEEDWNPHRCRGRSGRCLWRPDAQLGLTTPGL